MPTLIPTNTSAPTTTPYPSANAKDEAALRKLDVRGPVKKWSILGNISIGYHTSINGPFNARGEVEIGMLCAFGRHISMLSTNHNTNMINQHVRLQKELGFKKGTVSKGRIKVGHNVWIGDKATILSGVTIGHGAVIGANAVVVKDVKPFEIVAGAPAKHLKYRFSEMVIEQLLQIEWWNWSSDKMKKNQTFFELELNDSIELQLKDIVE